MRFLGLGLSDRVPKPFSCSRAPQYKRRESESPSIAFRTKANKDFMDKLGFVLKVYRKSRVERLCPTYPKIECWKVSDSIPRCSCLCRSEIVDGIIHSGHRHHNIRSNAERKPPWEPTISTPPACNHEPGTTINGSSISLSDFGANDFE